MVLREWDLERGHIGKTVKQYYFHEEFSVDEWILFSKRAREERAVAAERRLLVMEGKSQGELMACSCLSVSP